MPSVRALSAHLLCALVLLASLTLGCSANRAPATATCSFTAPSLRIAYDDFDADPNVVSASEAIDDLDVLVSLFDTAYAGSYAGEGRPTDDAIAHARAELGARAEWPPAELTRVLRDLFRFRDGHLSFGYDGHAPLRLLTVPMPADATAAGRAGAPAVELVDGDVPVLAIRSFDNAAEPALRTLPALARRLRRASQFVVDLRGNAGGNFTFAEDFVLELTDRTLRRLDEREVVSVAAAEGRANSVRHRLAQGGVPAAALPLFAAQIDGLEGLAAKLRDQRAPRADLVTTGATARGRAPTPLRSRAVFLVDGGCASACEMLVSLARQMPGVVIAGQNTRGGMAFGEIALFRLPRSGIMVSMGTRAFGDPLGDFVEGRGFAPDIRLGTDTALPDAVRLAREHVYPSREPRRYALRTAAVR